jgi:hypothetical protein
MDDQVRQTLSALGYDPAEGKKIMLSLLPDYMVSLCNDSAEQYGGLLLFDGLVKVHCGYKTILADEQMTISGSQVAEAKSLFIKPLEKRIKEEYVQLENINEIRMTGMWRTQHRTPLTFEVELIGRSTVSLELWLANGMLYVPGKRRPAQNKILPVTFQNPVADPLDNLY